VTSVITHKFNVINYLVQGSDIPTKLGYLLTHGNSVCQMPLLLPLVWVSARVEARLTGCKSVVLATTVSVYVQLNSADVNHNSRQFDYCFIVF